MQGSHIPVYCSCTHRNAAESTDILVIGEGFSGILARMGVYGSNVLECVTTALVMFSPSSPIHSFQLKYM